MGIDQIPQIPCGKRQIQQHQIKTVKLCKPDGATLCQSVCERQQQIRGGIDQRFTGDSQLRVVRHEQDDVE